MTGRPPPARPAPGQESVWDYPRPPSLQRSFRHVLVRLGGVDLVDTRRGWRICETSHPPVYYLLAEDFAAGALAPGDRSSFCEFKGAATYWHVTGGGVRRLNAAWSYPEPSPAYAAMAGAVALYPGRMDEVRLDGEMVTAQPGEFYGGWITSAVVGPFKGGPGTSGW